MKLFLLLAGLVVGNAYALQPTTTTLSQPNSPVAATVAVQLSAEAATSGSGGGGAARGGGSAARGGGGSLNDGTMLFWEGSRLLGTVVAAISYGQNGATYASANLSLPAGTFTPGTYVLTAQFAGNYDLEPSLSTSKTLVVTAGGGGTVNYPPAPTSPQPVVDYEYDAVGNLTKVTQAKGVPGFGFATQNTYDTLSRRRNTTDAKAGLIELGYPGGQEDVASVKDPRQLITQTPRDGFGQALQLLSPDTGASDRLYDAAGNLIASTDSRSVLASQAYDALNRPTSLVYSKPGSTSRAYSWTYDQTGGFFANGVDRLTTATFPEGSTSFAYDAQGRPAQVRQTLSANPSTNPQAVVLTTGYTYNAAGKLTSLSYPSGRKLTLSYTNGVLSGLGLSKDSTSAAVALISNLQYAPFGAPERWDWAMNAGALAHVRVMDSSGRLIRYPLGEHLRDISYDAAGRISAYTHYSIATGYASSAQDQQFGYDQLGRITQVSTALNTWIYTYDANGNRTSVALNGGAAAPYTIDSASNRLNAVSSPPITFSHDAAGNITADGNFTLGYDLSGRLSTVALAGQPTTSYTYDSTGQRVRKTSSLGSAGTVVFVYDSQGQLLGEYNATGQAIREYVWMDNVPVAVFVPDPTFGASVAPLVYYVHTDHLNTPRAVVDRNGTLRWRWLAEPFGTTAAETSPGGLSAFTFNLRFPGQYYDAESGAHYNMQRDYLPGVGRYAQSDPIGLAGGINTYAYTENNPISFTDPRGLVKWSGWAFNVAATAPFGASIYHVTLTSECKCGKQYTIKVVAVGPAAGLGVKLAATVSEVTFDDLDTCADPGSFDGRFTAGGGAVTGGAIPLPGPHARVGLGLPGVGIGSGYLQLGRNFTTGFFPPSFVAGRDMSVTGAVGSSTVMSVEPCDCK